jgi:predicted ATP-dependent endonuclease of OLD family
VIIGVFIRNVKTYSGINYIPLTYGQKFCGLVGINGIGKSSVLEALNYYFNNVRDWNFNISVKKGGISKTTPHIVPVFMLEKSELLAANLDLAERFSDFIWDLEEADVLTQNRTHFKVFQQQFEVIRREYSKENRLLLPIGLTHENSVNLSIFNTRKFGELFYPDLEKSPQVAETNLEIFRPILDELKSKHEYIYIPKDIDPESFIQLETKEIQSLMGEKLNEIVEKCVPNTKIQDINTALSNFLNELSSKLQDYAFRTPGERQVNLRKHDVNKLIIEAYFNIRKLHKKEGEHWLEMAVLSSGEKQKAIIEIAYQFLKYQSKTTDHIILAVDEPESSLHMSACYDQFQKLYELSSFCNQLMFTTHWYGFIPTIEDGCVSVISKIDGEHVFDLLSTVSYREAIKQTYRTSAGKLPYDIRIKSINDFTQSIITSILSDEPYNWLICEGSSEKLYFEKYFQDIKLDKKLRIIPVGGAKEIKRVYNNLQIPFDDFRKDINGKVVLITDTDPELVSFETKDELKNLICRRIVNNEKVGKTILVKVDSNPYSPKTEIEDALNGKLFLETLRDFAKDHPELDEVIGDIADVTEEASYLALDIAPSKRKRLDEFFDTGNNKYEFAKLYVQKVDDQSKTPSWIIEIKNFYQ